MDEKQIAHHITTLLPSMMYYEIKSAELVPLSSSYKLKQAGKSRVYNVVVHLKESTYYPNGAAVTLCKYFDGNLYFPSTQAVVSMHDDPEKAYNFLLAEIEKNFSKTATFGCCSRYKECSDKKECVHNSQFYSYGCIYRKNLIAGKIFYGKNKNV
ncbi:MAG: hypothetical protein SPF77_06905 [Gemmiger sp.]|uniref:hypothetical protein n=1 Tax=Gemmiger sp. TaxID=2049027 RepID=UPI002A9101C6|nr:hypothetical protein [Gemmiger sp.]MDY5502288.1 hypothetical protein [Gemmiger sp.]